MTAHIIDTQLEALPIIGKHLKAMMQELEDLRQKQGYKWGDGMFADVPEVVVTVDADEYVLGKFVANEANGYDWTNA